MSSLGELREIDALDDGCPHSRQFRRELVIARLAILRRLSLLQRRQLRAGRVW